MLELRQPDLFALHRSSIERLKRTIGKSAIINCFPTTQSTDLVDFSSQIEGWLNQKSNPTNVEKMLIQYFDTCKRTLTNCYVQLLPVLPFSHYPEIVITRAKCQPIAHVPIRKNAFNKDDHSIIVVENRNSYQDTANKCANGPHALRISCLEELGFNVICVPYRDVISAIKQNPDVHFLQSLFGL